MLDQEAQLGKDRMELGKLLQSHHVLVRGGPDEGQKLIEALLVRSCSQVQQLTWEQASAAVCVCMHLKGV